MNIANSTEISEPLGLEITKNPDISQYNKKDQKFYYFLILAFFMHASLLINITSLKPRRLGAPNGADNAISVSLINTKDLISRATVDDQSAGPLSQNTTASKSNEIKKQSQQNPKEKETTEKQQSNSVADSKGSGDNNLLRNEEISEIETSKEKNKPKQSKEIKPPQQTSKKNEAQENNKLARLDLSQPKLFALPSGGGGAGVQRPPGITRSGENDDFARGVIRALQQTMPQLSDTLGRVTVRIILDKNGSLVSTDVVVPSKVSGLDQSVVFATRQSSFPLPPINANSADLTFFVTYIYR